MYNNFMQSYIFALATVATTFLGGWLSIKNRHRLHLFISFTAGVVISVAFLEILPELFSIAHENNLDVRMLSLVLLAGFFGVHTIEKLVLYHNGHEHEYAEHRHPFVGYVGASGLIVHSFLDGLGIALGFAVGNEVGLVIALAVLAHDFSDGINTASMMMLSNHSNKKTYFFLGLDALAPLLGVFVAHHLTITPLLTGMYLAVFAGFLLYIGASDLLPEAHSREKSYKVLGLMLAGVLFTVFFTKFI